MVPERFVPKDVLMMRAIWRKAYKEGELAIPFETEAIAHRVRMMLYNAVKLAKQGKTEDFELIEAAESLEIVWGADRKTLLMRRKTLSSAFQSLEAALGKSMDIVTMPEAEESLKKVMETLKEEEIGKAVLNTKPLKNPFYDRSK